MESKPALTPLDLGHPQYVGIYDKNYAAVKARVDAHRHNAGHVGTPDNGGPTGTSPVAPLVIATPVHPSIKTDLDGISTQIQSWSKSTFVKSDVQKVVEQIESVQAKL